MRHGGENGPWRWVVAARGAVLEGADGVAHLPSPLARHLLVLGPVPLHMGEGTGDGWLHAQEEECAMAPNNALARPKHLPDCDAYAP